MIRIKPHHFLDIIKLYGNGIDIFKPDLEFGHDFYKVANEIINNKNVEIKITINEDDICKPCKHISRDGVCLDCINHIQGIESKDKWNKILDKRLIEKLGLKYEKVYLAEELCNIMYKNKEIIFDVWKEDSLEDNKKRFDLFCNGSEKYLYIM